MQRAFTKMHGLGNDFAVFDARAQPFTPTPAQARHIADRRRGVGCDQLILIEPSTRADAFMRIFNPDGSEAEACGNATRCVASLLGRSATIETRAGLLRTRTIDRAVRVDMGQARFGWQEVPLAYAMDTSALPVGWDGLAHPVALSMGNPHLVFIVPDVDAVDLAALGPVIEQDPLFPQRINVNIVQITSETAVRHRVWERGAGLTEACGSGACAVGAALVKRRLTHATLTVHMPGGALLIEVAEDFAVAMTGPVATAFSGVIKL
ncbi:diaminopimelate epimerase [Sandaracinobacteroides saxicola]|uniref:Diaminopimelate epimerase n=1 Tax=Sandaracinobacteroides saxicola TaxID=2759707 RepID=A0A7G5IF16_9SPHN|nr:diaminopimelate epimerase [Sandaracinobacteroides saxicola]QMW21958.1 diaminopimelate epimerase [Sandaracinobacteroides saxicola]